MSSSVCLNSILRLSPPLIIVSVSNPNPNPIGFLFRRHTNYTCCCSRYTSSYIRRRVRVTEDGIGVLSPDDTVSPHIPRNEQVVEETKLVEEEKTELSNNNNNSNPYPKRFLKKKKAEEEENDDNRFKLRNGREVS